MKKKKLSEINILEEGAITFRYSTTPYRYLMIHQIEEGKHSSIIATHEYNNGSKTSLIESRVSSSGILEAIRSNTYFIVEEVTYNGEQWFGIRSNTGATNSQLKVLILSGKGIDMVLDNKD